MGRNRRKVGAGAVESQVVNTFDKAAINTQLEDARWSMSVQGLIYDGEFLIRNALEEDDEMAEVMERLGLDPSKSRDIEMMSAIVSAFGEEAGETFVRQGAAGSGSDFDVIAVSTASDAMRGFVVKDDVIEVRNVSFAKGYAADKIRGVGFAMLARQAWALRKLGERLGKRVIVSTEALSDDDAWNGVELWPRTGYNFSLLQDGAATLLAEARNLGFQSDNTADLMTERTADGKLGVDWWATIVDNALNTNPESIKIKGSMEVTNDDDVGVQVMMAYGKAKKLW